MVEVPNPVDRPLGRIRVNLDTIELGVAVAVSAIVVTLHITLMFHAGALWRDEVNSVSVARMPSLPELWWFLRIECFPVLWFLILRCWSAVSWLGTDAGLRLFGLLVGLGMVCALWLNALLLDCGLPLLSLALLALNPVVIRYGDSIRGYGVGTCAILLTFTAFWRFTQSGTAKWAAWAALIGVLAVQSLYYNPFFLLAIATGCVAVALRARLWRRAVALVALGVPAALSMLPYVETLRKAESWNIIARLDLTANMLWAKLSEALGQPGPLAFMIWVWLGLIAAAVLLACVAQSSRWRPGLSPRQRDLALFSLVVMGASGALCLLFLKHLGFVTQPWYYVALMALWAVSLEAIFSATLTSAAARSLRLALVVLIAGLAAPPAYKALQPRHTNIDLIARQLQADARKGDLIVVLEWAGGVTFGRYYKGDADWTALPDPEDHPTVHRTDLLKEKMGDPKAIEPVLDRIGAALRSGHRVWLVGTLGLPPPGELPQHLPPPPLNPGPDGWYHGYYLAAWSAQAGYFLQTHAASLQQIPVETNVIIHERESLHVAAGWKVLRAEDVPGYAQAHYNLGVRYHQSGRIAEAMDQYREALRVRPNDPDTHNNLGVALLASGRAEEAVGHYHQALRANPNYSSAHYNMGLALQSLGKVAEAMDHYRQALKLKPDYAEAHYSLGTCLDGLGRPREALAQYQEALRLQPGLAAARERAARDGRALAPARNQAQ